MKKRLKTMLLALVTIMMPIGAWAYYEPEPEPEPEPVVITLAESGIATFYYSGESFAIPEDISASIITGVEVNEDGTVTVTEDDGTVTEDEKVIIPAGCAVILRGTPGEYNFDIYKGELNAPAPSDNLLLGSDEETTIGEEEYLYFTLDSENGENSASLKDWIYVGNKVDNEAHKAYLALPVVEYSELAEMLETLDNPHLQHTHGGCKICDQVTVIEAAWGTSADAETFTYGTLADAFEAAYTYDEENETYISTEVCYIQLLSDITNYNAYSISGGEYTFDLNGHTISSEGHTLYIANNSNVTIVDNSETKSGKVISSGEGCFAVCVDNSASVTINGGTYESTLHYALNVQGNNSSVTINGGSYVSSYLPVLIGEDCSATIVGGTFKYTGASAIENYGNLVVKGGTFTYDGDVDPDSYYTTINHFGGSIDLSDHPTDAINSIDVTNSSGEDITPGVETILLPEDYCFFDYSDDTPVTVLVYGGFYYIGEEPAKCTIAFDAGDGEGEMEDEIIYVGDYTLPECTFTAPEGMGFKAWLVGEDELQPREVVTIEANTTITAVWATLFEVSFDANGGTGSMDAVTTFSDFTLPECTFTAPEGMGFKGWLVGEDELQPREVVTIEANTTITAVWATLFEVSFDANGGTGSMDAVTTFSDFTLPECTFTAPEGMMFKAWQIDGGEYQPYEPVSIEGNTTIKALWTAYVPQIIIKMYDSANDGWHGDAIVVKKNGKEIGTATIEGYGSNGIVRYDYDNTTDYTFYWQYAEHESRYPEECSFEILIDEEEVFAAVRDEEENTFDCQSYENGELIHTIEHTVCPHTNFNNGVCAECGVTGGYCGAETNEGGAESVRWTISEDGTELTFVGQGAIVDYSGSSAKPWWRTYHLTITNIVIGNGITRIGNDALSDLDSFTEITIPSSVTTIGSMAFYGCNSLSTVTFNEGLEVIEGSAFVSCKALTEITIPEGVTEIGGAAFNYCTALTSITIPHSVTQIGGSAFPTTNPCTVYVSCNPQFEYTFGTNTTVVYAEHDSANGPCTVCGDFDGIHDGEHESFYVEKDIENIDITYTRTLPNLMWNALYVPFEIPLSELTDNYDVAYINDIRSYDNDENGEIDDMTMEIIRINSGTLNANHPYLIRAKNEEAQNMEIVLSDATLYRTEENSFNCSSMYMEFTITGTYNTLSYEDLEEKYAISTSGAWQKLSVGSSLKPFRLYMEMTPRDGSPVKVEAAALSRIRINMQGEGGNTTGVEILEAQQSINDAVLYDLYGRKVTTPVKGGIYISNGKKVIVK